MLGKLKEIEIKYEDISRQLTDPVVISNQEQYVALMKELNGISEIVKVYREYVQTAKEIDDIYIMLKENSDDADFKQLLQEELAQLEEKKPALEQQLKILLLPVDPNDTKNVIIEIRGGAGGDEAALFAADLLRMYTMYAEAKKWKTEILDLNEIGIGGIKEVVFSITGQGAYSRFKYESGVHRVQRVPETESQGRIHTSTVTVAVLPEAEEVDIEIKPNEIRIDTFCSSGPGGQSVNTTYSAIRILHIPTGLIVSCQDQKSQHQNREKALQVLRSRLLARQEEERLAQESSDRKSQVGAGDRADKIRTYNFPQDRVTDHRINTSWHNITDIMEGAIEEIITELKKAAKNKIS